VLFRYKFVIDFQCFIIIYIPCIYQIELVLSATDYIFRETHVKQG